MKEKLEEGNLTEERNDKVIIDFFAMHVNLISHLKINSNFNINFWIFVNALTLNFNLCRHEIGQTTQLKLASLQLKNYIAVFVLLTNFF